MTTSRQVRISVRGHLSDRLEHLFEPLVIVRTPGRTELVGEVADQAQLHGQLARIRDLGLELESIQTSDGGNAPLFEVPS